MVKPKHILTFLVLTTPILALQPQPEEQIQQKPLWPTTSAPQVTLPQGHILGTVIQREDFPQPIDAFLGIPYAEPPVGPNGRFFPARPVGNDSEREIGASKWGAKCPGRVFVDIGPPLGQSEDCLTVNLFRGKGVAEGEEEGKKLPVGIWVHGGAFNRGTASQLNLDSMVAWSEEPFIGVSFNYRIGALGFLPSKITAEEGILNLGLRDQILLFKWVQDNIAAFGGDPDQVTLFGLSAGAHSIGHHLMNYNPEEKPLFHRVIMESGAPTARAIHPFDAPIHEEQFQKFVTAAGCTEEKTSETLLTCLRTQPSSTIFNAQNTVFSQYNIPPTWAFQPVIDGSIIKLRPTLAWETGIWNKVPILTGFNHNEGTMYVPKTINTSAEFLDFFKQLSPKLSDEDMLEIDRLYPDPDKYPTSPYTETRNITVGNQFKRLEAAYGHYAYVCNVLTTAHMASSPTNPPVYLYHWSTNSSILSGANHGDQIPYETYDFSIRSISQTQEELSGYVHAYWTSFITKGDPNLVRGRWGGRPRWEAFGVGGEVCVLGEGNDERAGGGERGVVAKVVRGEGWAGEECAFWGGRARELDH